MVPVVYAVVLFILNDRIELIYVVLLPELTTFTVLLGLLGVTTVLAFDNTVPPAPCIILLIPAPLPADESILTLYVPTWYWNLHMQFICLLYDDA